MPDKVLASVENSHRDHCVDIFLRPDGTYGFEEYRRDPEDNGRWQCLNRYAPQVFNSLEDAMAKAKTVVIWLKDDA
jgi:hypothetical protein